MPLGNPSKQTIASEKYQKKAGWITKGFKLKKNLCDEFAEACEKAGIAQSAQISKMMREFIESTK